MNETEKPKKERIKELLRAINERGELTQVKPLGSYI